MATRSVLFAVFVLSSSFVYLDSNQSPNQDEVGIQTPWGNAVKVAKDWAQSIRSVVTTGSDAKKWIQELVSDEAADKPFINVYAPHILVNDPSTGQQPSTVIVTVTETFVTSVTATATPPVTSVTVTETSVTPVTVTATPPVTFVTVTKTSVTPVTVTETSVTPVTVTATPPVTFVTVTETSVTPVTVTTTPPVTFVTVTETSVTPVTVTSTPPVTFVTVTETSVTPVTVTATPPVTFVTVTETSVTPVTVTSTPLVTFVTVTETSVTPVTVTATPPVTFVTVTETSVTPHCLSSQNEHRIDVSEANFGGLNKNTALVPDTHGVTSVEDETDDFGKSKEHSSTTTAVSIVSPAASTTILPTQPDPTGSSAVVALPPMDSVHPMERFSQLPATHVIVVGIVIGISIVSASIIICKACRCGCRQVEQPQNAGIEMRVWHQILRPFRCLIPPGVNQYFQRMRVSLVTALHRESPPTYSEAVRTAKV